MKSSKIKKIIKLILFITVAAVVLVTGLNVYIILKTKDKIVNVSDLDEIDSDCILVLGAGVRDDGSPSHMLEDRLLTGIDIYENGKCDVLLMSGDHGREEYDEVNCMKDFAVEKGIPSDDIFMDHAGFSTYDSLYRAKYVFGAEKVIIVTQKYHLYRALYIADALGLEAVGVSADLRTYFGQSMRETREIAARIKDFGMTILQPESKYLGEPISLDDSGDVTNG
ncbi:MAG: SanA protein [Ruminococcaceae bacterium]|nr:SanA protein [Oscillospiraceae bacterium]